MWRVASGPSYRKKMSCLNSSYSYKDKRRKTRLTSWENNNSKRSPQSYKETPDEQQKRDGLQAKIETLNKQLQEKEL